MVDSKHEHFGCFKFHVIEHAKEGQRWGHVEESEQSAVIQSLSNDPIFLVVWAQAQVKDGFSSVIKGRKIPGLFVDEVPATDLQEGQIKGKNNQAKKHFLLDVVHTSYQLSMFQSDAWWSSKCNP